VILNVQFSRCLPLPPHLHYAAVWRRLRGFVSAFALFGGPRFRTSSVRTATSAQFAPAPPFSLSQFMIVFFFFCF